MSRLDAVQVKLPTLMVSEVSSMNLRLTLPSRFDEVPTVMNDVSVSKMASFRPTTAFKFLFFMTFSVKAQVGVHRMGGSFVNHFHFLVSFVEIMVLNPLFAKHTAVQRPT
jgi:hypothetical protein